MITCEWLLRSQIATSNFERLSRHRLALLDAVWGLIQKLQIISSNGCLASVGN